MKPSTLLFEEFDSFLNDPLNGLLAGSAFLLFVLIRAALLQWAEYQPLYRSFWTALLGGIFAWLTMGLILWLQITLNGIMVFQGLALLGLALGIDLLFTLLLTGKTGNLIGGVLGSLLGYVLLASACLFTYIAFAYPSSALWTGL
ncbi:MAG: hypothetical protein ACOYK5_02740 [Bacteroidia bacterium]|jgi:hypothetical protein